MLKIGDTVKVIDRFHYEDGTTEEHIPIGTICTVIDTCKEIDGTYSFCVRPKDDHMYFFWYAENELEKGHMEWIKDE